ncbi:LysE family translocator [Stappia sp. ES.058]|uniref:LysE family translocator n=1 Tax=Stappia sp. ES.058 TaxID=1881061 RepID=UPI00087938FC|nr:LysE family translocator [Stappia sp. ES.058]SDU19400.1 Threonine/homoserine/homoserine lactone efflux protein [Stappia sp. ES.058]
MDFDIWLAFAVASFLMLAVPGPTILLVVSYALSQGRSVAAAVVAGVVLGDLTAMTASISGLGALLATSATLFTVLKWVGAAYLVWLGLKLWRAPVATKVLEQETQAQTVSPLRIVGHSYAVTALNPKSIVFFVAFLPLFVDPTRPLLGQAVILEATFVVLAALNAAAFGFMAAAVGARLTRPSVRRAINRIGGSAMIGAGLLVLGWRRTTN